MLRIVNIIPATAGDECRQDSEPNLAVNPDNPKHMVATAFTPGSLDHAPIYFSTDGGNTWCLNEIVPGNGPVMGTQDITVGFAAAGGTLYAGILHGVTAKMQILRTPNFISTTPMDCLLERNQGDHPWVVVGGAPEDRVFVGSNNMDVAFGGRTATVEVSQDAAIAPAPAGFGATIQLNRRAAGLLGYDGSPVRTAIHSDGRIYVAFQRYTHRVDIVVARDDDWGSGASPFEDLKDSVDAQVGQRVATNRLIPRYPPHEMAQERLGNDLAIAVDPTDKDIVWVAWCDRVGGVGGTDYSLHVERSDDGGQTWLQLMEPITNAMNPALAVNSSGVLGLAYQQWTGNLANTWDTKLELIANNSWMNRTSLTLHTAPANVPTRKFPPYIGDYMRLLSVGSGFYGVFCGNNEPKPAHFPTVQPLYQRLANWATHTLLRTDGTAVQVSIDPFFFHWTPGMGVNPDVLTSLDRFFGRTRIWENPFPPRVILPHRPFEPGPRPGPGPDPSPP